MGRARRAWGRIGLGLTGAACAGLTGCASAGGPADPQVEVSVREDFAQQRFRVELANHGRPALCVDMDGWPERGQIAPDAATVVLIDGGKAYPLKQEGAASQSGMRSGQRLRLLQDQVLIGWFAFSQFDDPGLASPNESRELKFEPRTWLCDQTLKGHP
jgi:hypothetical protein